MSGMRLPPATLTTRIWVPGVPAWGSFCKPGCGGAGGNHFVFGNSTGGKSFKFHLAQVGTFLNEPGCLHLFSFLPLSVLFFPWPPRKYVLSWYSSTGVSLDVGKYQDSRHRQCKHFWVLVLGVGFGKSDLSLPCRRWRCRLAATLQRQAGWGGSKGQWGWDVFRC